MRETTLDARLSTSVWYGEHVYGFDGRFLSCVDGATGAKVWKSRPPGGGGLIRVDDNLVILGQGGDVVLTRATPAGYEERARVNALDGDSVTYPSFAAGLVYVRNTREIAAVRAVARSTPAPAPALDVSSSPRDLLLLIMVTCLLSCSKTREDHL